jgi:hypothetical protein
MGIQSDPPNSLYAASGTAADDNVNVRDQLPPDTDQNGYSINEQPMGTKRKVKVILMGAGASTLNFFKKAEEEMENLEMVCYEKNHDVGGTSWLRLRHPKRQLSVLMENQTLVALLLILPRDLGVLEVDRA